MAKAYRRECAYLIQGEAAYTRTAYYVDTPTHKNTGWVTGIHAEAHELTTRDMVKERIQVNLGSWGIPLTCKVVPQLPAGKLPNPLTTPSPPPSPAPSPWLIETVNRAPGKPRFSIILQCLHGIMFYFLDINSWALL